MTDGSFQIVREYSVDGDRVRYWSLERAAWEEIPENLVDWDATHKAEAEQAQKDAALKSRIRETDPALVDEINIDRSLEVKPSIFLPDEVGFYLLDGKRVLVLKQSAAASKLDKSREVERVLTGVAGGGTPLVPSKVTFELPGERASLRISNIDPEFFMRPADQREPRFSLWKAQVKGGRRILESTSQSPTGEKTQHSQNVDFQTWTPAEGVFRYTLSEKLMPGEYAFVEATDQGVSGYVWDFGVDPPPKQAPK